jgi:hypothetical protein
VYRQAPSHFSDFGTSIFNALGRSLIIVEQGGIIITERASCGSGKGRDIDHEAGLEGFLRPPIGIGQNHSSLSICTEDFHGFARHGREHIAWADCVAVWHVFRQGRHTN